MKSKAKKSKDVVETVEAKRNLKTRKSSVSKSASKNELVFLTFEETFSFWELILNCACRSISSLKSSAEDSEQAKTRKKSISLAYSRLMAHKYSNAFQKPITNKQVPGYEDVVYL